MKYRKSDFDGASMLDQDIDVRIEMFDKHCSEGCQEIKLDTCETVWRD